MSSEDKAYTFILPVLFLEYLAISITKSLLPGMIIEFFGEWSYAVVGLLETVKGVLAFFACPIIGKVSDRIGRKYCILGETLLIVFIFQVSLFFTATVAGGFCSNDIST